jgi:hypothetical protein
VTARLSLPFRSPRRAALALLIGLAAGSTGCSESTKQASGEVSIDREALDFGDVAVGDRKSLSVAITNDTEGWVLEILSSSAVEGSAAIWQVERQADDVEPGATVAVDVEFSPNEVGDEEARVQIRTGWVPGSGDGDPPVEAPTWDVFTTGSGTASVVDADDDGFSPADGDCDDNNAARFPGNAEICDGIDNDCDGTVDITEADGDYDGVMACEGDCDDYDANVYPGAPEICDGEGKDNDCNGIVEDYEDADGDLYTICDGDCDDLEPYAHPDLTEVCDLIDNDCSGAVDDIDEDGDGHSPCSGGGDCDDNDADAFPVIVDPESTAGVPDGTLEAPFADIPSALENLDPICRTIVLAPATYVVDVDWSDRSVQLNGRGEGPDEVTLTTDAGDPSRMFTITNDASVKLVNLTLAGGYANGDGGAIYAENGNVELEGVIARENRCTGDGAVVAVASGNLTIRESVFRDNIAEDDGGALAVLSGELVDRESLYENNTAVRGGAILAESSGVTLQANLFVDNEAAVSGGAMAMTGGGTLAIEGNRFFSNLSRGDGGAVVLTDVLVPEGYVRNNHIAENQAAGAGGGLHIAGNNAGGVIHNNTVHGNAGGEQGAGINLEASNAEDLYLWSNLITYSNGDYGVWVFDGSNANVAHNSAYATTAGESRDFELYSGEDYGFNRSENPEYDDYSPDADPTNDILSLSSISPVRDAGPTDGSGPEGYTDWADADGSVNDRGMTGGPGLVPEIPSP